MLEYLCKLVTINLIPHFGLSSFHTPRHAIRAHSQRRAAFEEVHHKGDIGTAERAGAVDIAGHIQRANRRAIADIGRGLAAFEIAYRVYNIYSISPAAVIDIADYIIAAAAAQLDLVTARIVASILIACQHRVNRDPIPPRSRWIKAGEEESIAVERRQSCSVVIIFRIEQ